MSVRPIQLGNGLTRWRVVADIGPDPRTGKRRQKTLTFDDEPTARAEYKRLREEGRKRRADHERLYGRPGDEGITVNEILDNYLASLKCSDRTLASYRGAVRHIREQIGPRPAHTITSEDIEHIIEHMTTRGRRRGGAPGSALSSRSAMVAIGRLRAAYELAVFQGKITRRVIPIDPEPGVVVLA